jgi:hypothetical protein
MSVRPMQEADIPAAVEMIKEFCGEMEYPFDAVSSANFLFSAMKQRWCLSVVEDDNKPIGLCGAMVVPHLADFSSLRLVEFLWHSLPSLPSVKRAKAMTLMLDTMEKFATERGFRLSVSTSVAFPALEKLVRKRGFAPYEVVYVKEN